MDSLLSIFPSIHLCGCRIIDQSWKHPQERSKLAQKSPHLWSRKLCFQVESWGDPYCVKDSKQVWKLGGAPMSSVPSRNVAWWPLQPVPETHLEGLLIWQMSLVNQYPLAWTGYNRYPRAKSSQASKTGQEVMWLSLKLSSWGFLSLTCFTRKHTQRSQSKDPFSPWDKRGGRRWQVWHL